MTCTPRHLTGPACGEGRLRNPLIFSTLTFVPFFVPAQNLLVGHDVPDATVVPCEFVPLRLVGVPTISSA